MVSCLMKNLTRKMKLKIITQRLGVSNIIIKSEKCYVLKLFKELKFELIGLYLCMLHYYENLLIEKLSANQKTNKIYFIQR